MDDHGAIKSDELAAFIYGGMSVAQRGNGEARATSIHSWMHCVCLWTHVCSPAWHVRAFLRVCVSLRGRRAGREWCLNNSLERLTLVH